MLKITAWPEKALIALFRPVLLIVTEEVQAIEGMVGAADGANVGSLLGPADGTVVGLDVGTLLGLADGTLDGLTLGTLVEGAKVGLAVGFALGLAEGTVVGI